MTACASACSARPHSFAHLVESLAALADNRGAGAESDLSVGDITAVIGRRSHGPLLLFVGLFSISPATILPGMTWLAASLALALSLQLALGARHPWLPSRLLRTRLSRALLRAATSDGLRAWARRLDLLLKPRLVLLSEPPFANLTGALCAVAALATFPLGLIPVAPLAPGLAITLAGLGLFARDGFLLLVAGALVAGSLGAVYATALLI